MSLLYSEINYELIYPIYIILRFVNLFIHIIIILIGIFSKGLCPCNILTKYKLGGCKLVLINGNFRIVGIKSISSLNLTRYLKQTPCFYSQCDPKGIHCNYLINLRDKKCGKRVSHQIITQ